MSGEEIRSVVISVILPVHNGAATLARCLEAIVGSGDASCECIVVDDSSTDSSREIAESFPVRLLALEGGACGPAHARNQGAEAARGDILFFVDADVLVVPGTLAKVADAFQAGGGCDAVFGSYDDMPEARGFLSQFKNLSHHFVHQSGSEDAVTFWSGCGAVRRDAFLGVGGFDEVRYPRPSIEDIELGSRLIRAGYKIRLDKALQVKHLKRWTLPSMVKSDIFDRGIPWTRLMLERRGIPNDLNLRHSQRLSALFVCSLLLYLAAAVYAACAATACFRHLLSDYTIWLVVPVVSLLVAVVGLNYRFYVFLIRKRGVFFAAAAVPFHMLYFAYSVISFAAGLLLFLWGRMAHLRAGLARRPTVPGG